MSLEDESGPTTGQVVQRRRLARLAVLGVEIGSDSRSARRAPLARARHRGRATPTVGSVYVIRRALGDAIITAGEDVRLDGTYLRVDVRDLPIYRQSCDRARATSVAAVSLGRG